MDAREPGSHPNAGRFRKEAMRTLVFAGVWLIFLAFPLAYIVGSEEPAGLIVLAFAGVAAFVIVYLAFWFVLVRFSTAKNDRARAGLVLATIGALGVCVAATLPVIGVAATSFLAYFVAVIAFSLPLRWSLFPAIVLVAAAAAWVIAESQPGWPLQLGGSTVGALIVLAIAVVSSQEEADAAMRSRLEQFRTRERIARDVHDLLGHGLTVIVLKAQLARRSVRTDPDRAEREIDDLLELAQNALAEVRATVGELRDPDLAAQLDAVRTACNAADVRLVVHGAVDAVPLANRPLAAWTLREAVTNLIRHADARTCTVSLRHDGISIVDDGRGCAGIEFGNGLDGLQKRIADRGGRLVVAEAHPRRDPTGTRVEALFA